MRGGVPNYVVVEIGKRDPSMRSLRAAWLKANYGDAEHVWLGEYGSAEAAMARAARLCPAERRCWPGEADCGPQARARRRHRCFSAAGHRPPRRGFRRSPSTRGGGAIGSAGRNHGNVSGGATLVYRLLSNTRHNTGHPVIWIEWLLSTLFDASLLTPEPPSGRLFFAAMYPHIQCAPRAPGWHVSCVTVCWSPPGCLQSTQLAGDLLTLACEGGVR